MLVMKTRGAKGLLKRKVKLGADTAVVTVPKGRDAASGLAMRAEMLTYSRSRDLFAGVVLEGSTLQDNRANQNVYGRKIDAEFIVRKGGLGVPPSDPYSSRFSTKSLSRTCPIPNF
jgi:lipid-binding SYLF domain-containing protein